MNYEVKKDTPQQAQFRQHCREWLSKNNPPIPEFRMPKDALEISTPEQIAYCCAWQKAAYDAGLVGCDYPKEVGGGGLENCQLIANQEMRAAKTPLFPNPIGLGIAAPTIFQHASEELKQRLLPKLFSGEEVWCQGFSEPGTGSDLASVQTFAERKGEKWIVNGHKVWTTSAHYATWMILLVRTDKTKKQDGLTYFIAPIKAALGKGVTVRPLIKMSGETGFNEVIFENLEIDDKYRLDEIGAGWKVAMTTLTNERGAGKFIRANSGGQAIKGEHSTPKEDKRIHPLISLARKTIRNGKPVIEDAILRDKIMQQVIRNIGVQTHRSIRNVSGIVENPTRFALQDKFISTEYLQAMSSLGLEIEGAHSKLYVGDENAPDGAKWPLGYLNSFAGTIAGGTSEIQKNIFAERILGLPKTK